MDESLEIDEKLLNKMNDTFIELKSNTTNIIKNVNNIDSSLLMESINNLDNLMESIKDL